MKAGIKAIVTILCIALFGVLTAAAAPADAPADSYQLGSGDKIHLVVFGQSDLSGDFVVDGTGNVQLPLVGQVKAAGLSSVEFEKEVVQAYRNAEILKDPRVSVQVINYRPFYIIGEVNKPGEYPYVNGMTALNAVAVAGGYTWRGDDSVVYIRRNGSEEERRFPADQSTKIQPGDVIRVGERFF